MARSPSARRVGAEPASTPEIVSSGEERTELDLEPRYGLERLFTLAANKDRGFDIPVFVGMLGQFRRLRREEFDLDDASCDRLVETVATWRAESAR